MPMYQQVPLADQKLPEASQRFHRQCFYLVSANKGDRLDGAFWAKKKTYQLVQLLDGSTLS